MTILGAIVFSEITWDLCHEPYLRLHLEITKQHKYSWNNRQLADCFLNKSLEIMTNETHSELQNVFCVCPFEEKVVNYVFWILLIVYLYMASACSRGWFYWLMYNKARYNSFFMLCCSYKKNSLNIQRWQRFIKNSYQWHLQTPVSVNTSLARWLELTETWSFLCEVYTFSNILKTCKRHQSSWDPE